MTKIILASNSPRRKKILTDLGLEFEVVPSNYEEKLETDVFSYDLIEDLATENISIDYSKKIYEVINKYHKQIEKTKEYYKIIINMANIRPIEWLNY